MRWLCRSHKNQYKMEQDKIRAPRDLKENTYQLMKQYQLANPSLSIEVDPADINQMVSPKMMTLNIAQIVVTVLVGTAAIIGLVYYLTTTNNDDMQYPSKEGSQMPKIVEYLERHQSEEEESDTDSQMSETEQSTPNENDQGFKMSITVRGKQD